MCCIFFKHFGNDGLWDALFPCFFFQALRLEDGLVISTQGTSGESDIHGACMGPKNERSLWNWFLKVMVLLEPESLSSCGALLLATFQLVDDDIYRPLERLLSRAIECARRVDSPLQLYLRLQLSFHVPIHEDMSVFLDLCNGSNGMQFTPGG
jgi:hypothetical protein